MCTSDRDLPEPVKGRGGCFCLQRGGTQMMVGWTEGWVLLMVKSRRMFCELTLALLLKAELPSRLDDVTGV